MRDRLIALIGALVSFALLYGVFAPGQRQVDVGRPTSVDKGASGYTGLDRWLSEAGVSTASLRGRFTELDQAFAEPGNILIVTMPLLNAPDAREVQALRDWVARGNTLFLLAALNDTPYWSYQGDFRQFESSLTQIANVAFVVGNTDDPELAAPPDRPLPEPRVDSLSVAGNHWLLADISELKGVSPLPAAVWEAVVPDSPYFYELAWRDADARGAMWLRTHGAGQMLVSAYGSLLQNDTIALGDNRQLPINLISHYLGRSAQVIFDDAHHGLGAIYDPRAFFADPRLSRSIYLVIFAWLLYVVLSAGRLGPPRDPVTGTSSADFVRATGWLLARKTTTRDLAALMFNQFFADLRDRLHLPPDGPPPWQALRAAPRMRGDLYDSLLQLYDDLQAGRDIDTVYLHNQISEARRAFD